MQIIYESIFVGIYSVILYSIIYFYSTLFKAISMFFYWDWVCLFILGFSKHFLSYYLSIQDYYCEHGEACMRTDDTLTFIASHDGLLVESLIEGVVFMILGILMFSFVPFFRKRKIFSVFLISIAIHFLAEWVGFHTYFCKNKCKQLYE